MRLKYFLLLLLFPVYTASAQLVISPGGQLSLTGMTLTIENTDFLNNGNFLQGAGIIAFSGNGSSFIGGDQPLQFPQMHIRKTNNASVILQKPIKISISLSFISGFLNLNGFDIDLGSTGRLELEGETSHITGTNGGQVIFNTVLTAPSGTNPGNLGAVITSSESLGNVIIKRGHQPQSAGGPGSSIRRYYDIIPTENANLNAELKFNYLDGELNGRDENSLGVFKSEDGVDWIDMGFNTRNSQNNFVTKNGIGSFSRWTLSNSSTTLPVHFVLFNLWPNPVHDNVFITIVSGAESQGTIRLFDSKGSLLKIQNIHVLQGNNQFSVDMRSLPAGAYLLSAEWNRGQMKKGIQVVKR